MVSFRPTRSSFLEPPADAVKLYRVHSDGESPVRGNCRAPTHARGLLCAWHGRFSLSEETLRCPCFPRAAATTSRTCWVARSPHDDGCLDPVLRSHRRRDARVRDAKVSGAAPPCPPPTTATIRGKRISLPLCRLHLRVLLESDDPAARARAWAPDRRRRRRRVAAVPMRVLGARGRSAARCSSASSSSAGSVHPGHIRSSSE